MLMSPDKRGFVFTIDAFVALVLVSLIILVIVYQLNIPSAFFPQQAQTYDYARDVVGTLSASTIGDLKLTGGYPQADSYSPTEDEHTVLEQMAKEILNNNNPGALALATQLLTSGTSPLIPVQYGVKIGVKNAAGSWQEITVRDRPFTRIQSSANYVIDGHSRDSNHNSASSDCGACYFSTAGVCSISCSSSSARSHSKIPVCACVVYFSCNTVCARSLF